MAPADTKTIEVMTRQVDEMSDLLERDILNASRADPLVQVAGLAVLFLMPALVLFFVLSVSRTEVPFSRDIIFAGVTLGAGLLAMIPIITRFVLSREQRLITSRLMATKIAMADQIAARVMVWIDKTSPEDDLVNILPLKVQRLKQLIEEARNCMRRLERL